MELIVAIVVISVLSTIITSGIEAIYWSALFDVYRKYKPYRCMGGMDDVPKTVQMGTPTSKA